MVLPACDYFCLAAYWKDLELLEIFTTQITDPSERDCNMGYALIATLEDIIGKLEDYDGVVQFLLLHENRNWNIPQEDCEQALISATREGQLGYKRMLLDAELDVDAARDYDVLPHLSEP